MKNFEPGPRAQVAIDKDNDSTLVFVRELAHPPERVWESLTDPAELAAWAPFDADRNLGQPGPATLNMAGGPAPAPSPTNVLRADRPRLLEYTWGTDRLIWQLEPIAAGTRLTLRHTVGDRAWLTKVAAGWHICLDVAARALAGAPVGRIVAQEAMAYGWERLVGEYAAALGLPRPRPEDNR
jgi:uncharacterized protein YndB with AHSA1/START domain